MDGIGQYLLTILVGAILCAIITKLSGKSSANAAIIKLLTEIVLLILVISPLVKIKITDITDYLTNHYSADEAISIGESYANEQTDELIKQSVAAYILDKASSNHADIQVEVSLSDAFPKVPVGVVISGDVSPYIKIVLKKTIADELGIPEESQVWK